jgi:hypothetical protein
MNRYFITFDFKRYPKEEKQDQINELTFTVFADNPTKAYDKGFKMLDALNPELLSGVVSFRVNQI